MKYSSGPCLAAGLVQELLRTNCTSKRLAIIINPPHFTLSFSSYPNSPHHKLRICRKKGDGYDIYYTEGHYTHLFRRSGVIELWDETRRWSRPSRGGRAWSVRQRLIIIITHHPRWSWNNRMINSHLVEKLFETYECNVPKYYSLVNLWLYVDVWTIVKKTSKWNTDAS